MHYIYIHHISETRTVSKTKLKLLYWEIHQRLVHLSLRLIQWANKCFSGSDFSTEIVFQTIMQFRTVLTIFVAGIVFSPQVVPNFVYFLYTSDLCHKCTRTGSQSGYLRTETFRVITKALPSCHFFEF